MIKLKPKPHQTEEDFYACELCGYEAHIDDWHYDEEKKVLICPICGTDIEI